MVSGIGKLPVDMELLFTSTVAAATVQNQEKGVAIADRIAERGKLQKKLGDVLALASQVPPKFDKIAEMLAGDKDLNDIVGKHMPTFTKPGETTTTTSRLDDSRMNAFINSLPSPAREAARAAANAAGGSAERMIDRLEDIPFVGRDLARQARAALTVTSTSTSQTQVPLSEEEKQRAIQGFIDAVSRENDNFSPMNQLDLAAFTRVAQNDNLMTKAVSDMGSAYHSTRKDIIGNIGKV